MLALTDPARATRIVMDTGDFYVRQLLIRAAAVGERIAIYSSEPARWLSLSQVNIAVVERHQPPEFVPSIIVNDRPTTPPSAGLSATVITLGEADAAGPAPDLRFVQVSRDTVRVTASGDVAGRGDRGVPPGTGVDRGIGAATPPGAADLTGALHLMYPTSSRSRDATAQSRPGQLAQPVSA